MSDHQQGIGSSFNISAATWFPQPTANLTGTIAVNTGRQVIGTSTLFKTQLSLGDWILVPGSNEIQQVVRIDDNTTLYLANPFVATVTTPAASTYQRIKNEGLKEMQVTFITSAGTVRGSTQPTTAGASVPAGLTIPFKYQGRLDPQLVTPGATAFVFTVL